MKGWLILAVGLAVAACSSGDDSAATGADSAATAGSAGTVQPSDPCGIVSEAEMSGAVGATVTERSSAGANTCVFKTGGPLVYASVEIDREGAAAWEGINSGDSLIGAAQDSLAGIGDKAFFGPREKLYIMKGSTFIAVEAGFDDSVRVRAKRVGRLVASKL